METERSTKACCYHHWSCFLSWHGDQEAQYSYPGLSWPIILYHY